MIRRFGPPPDLRRRYTPRHGAYAVALRDRRVLVTLQKGPRREIQLPGGGVDPGESVLMALYRETLEETGWTLADPRRLGVFRRYAYMPEYDLWAEKICHVYLARPVLRRGPPLEREHEAFWMSPQRAMEQLATEGDAWFLGRALGI